MPETDFDDTEVFEEKIRPLVEQIAAICEVHDLVAIMAFCKARTGFAGRAHMTSCLPPGKTPGRFQEAADLITSCAMPEFMSAFLQEVPDEPGA